MKNLIKPLHLKFPGNLKFFIIFIFIFGVLNLKAAVVVENTSSNGAFNATGVMQLNWSHTVGGGISRALVVGVSTNTPISVPVSRVSAVTYTTMTSQNLTRIGTNSISPDGRSSVELFILVAPVSGTGTISVNLLPGVNYVVGGGVSFTGVNQSLPTGMPATASGTNGLPTVTVTDSLAGDVVLDTVGISPDGQFLVENMSQMLAWNGRGFFFFAFDIGAGSTKPASSPVTTNWISSGIDQNWAIAAVAVKSFAPTSAGGNIGGRVFSGSERGLSGALLTLTGTDGRQITARTNPFGYFRLSGMPFGETYILEVNSKEFVFAPQVIAFNEDIRDLNLFPVKK